MVEERGTDVVQVPQQGEEATAELVVPDLKEKRTDAMGRDADG